MAEKKKKRGTKVLRRVKLGKCSNVGNDIKAKGDSARSRRRRSQGGACLVRKRVARPVKTGMRTVLSPAEALRREAARKKKRAALRRAASKRASVKNGREFFGMTAKAAYAAGRDEGYNAVIYGEFSPGATRDEVSSEAFEIEENARQYAGHPTYDIESDAAHDAYDRGVAVGIKKGIAKRFAKPKKRAR